MRNFWTPSTLQEQAYHRLFMDRPSVMLGLVPMLDGNAWSVVYGSNAQEGICGFGDTPDEAMKEFDREWHSNSQTTTGDTQ